MGNKKFYRKVVLQEVFDITTRSGLASLTAALHGMPYFLENPWTRVCIFRCPFFNMARDTLAQASVIRFRSSCSADGGVAYILSLMYLCRENCWTNKMSASAPLIKLLLKNWLTSKHGRSQNGLQQVEKVVDPSALHLLVLWRSPVSSSQPNC
ncbi:hypothetical protein TNCV_2298431 [Trichonephila clavipes]|nr:hypothetical protein TNCV_2298431 [Trichonephila clavipes]